ncbi:MAG: ATP-binding protein [Gammaproteobacteria bacterium]|nr:ATP-binding protein [Gammaproteobacteria bacterium]MCW9003658.1 ATP-binding protein [Gammaproteobacteria bacterium]
MKRFLSLEVILPLVLIAIALLMIVVSMANGLLRGQEAITKNSIDDIKREISRIAAISERALHLESQLLEDDLTRIATDVRVSSAMIIDTKGIVVYASDFSLRGSNVKNALENFNELDYQNALNQKSAIIRSSDDGNYFVAMMSYVEPASSHMLRSIKKGVVYLSYDVSPMRQQVFRAVLFERSLEMMIMLIAAVIIALVSNRYLVRPLADLKKATDKFSTGEFNDKVSPAGLSETISLANSFNRMAAQLASNINQLQSQQKNTQAILDNVIDGIITINGAGIIQSYNKSAEKIFGYNADEVMGCNVKMLMPEPYHSEHDGYLSDYLTSGHAKIIGIGREVEGKRKNNESFSMDLAVTEIEKDAERLFIGIVRDITERKKIDKLKSEFISTISHELRTPLTSINGAVSLVLSGLMGKLNDQGKDLMKSAHRNGERLLCLINDLLDMEKIIAGHMQLSIKAQELSPVLEEALKINQSYAEKFNVTLKIDQAIGDVVVRIDQFRLMQVITNFISNACKFSGNGSEVVLRSEVLGETVRVSVVDQGAGIDDEFKSHVFDKFSQADASDTRSHGGTGLGLAIAKDLVESMGGVIGVESEKDKGSTFYFDLPIVSDSV